MTHDADTTGYPVVMDVADWLRINGTMDNELHNLREKAWEWPPDQPDPELADLTQLGMSIRQAGWDQISDWPSPEGLQRWPDSLGRSQAITLTARQWGLVVSALERWTVVAESIDQLDEAVTGRRIMNLVRDSLTRQGLDPVPAVRPDW